MRVKLNQLQRVVKQALDEEKATELLREEVTKILGPTIDTSVRLEELAMCVNDRVVTLEKTGRKLTTNFKPSSMIRFINHPGVEVRKMCAKLLPENLAQKLANDSSPAVRMIVAKRSSLRSVKEVTRKFPGDKNLFEYYIKTKNLSESTERLGDVVKQQSGPELSDNWYRNQADLFMQDYGQDIYGTTGQAIDYNWEEQVVKNFCRHSKATSGVEIDEKKLLKAVKDLELEREESVLKNESSSKLRDMVSLLNEQCDHEEKVNLSMPVLLEEINPIKKLISTRTSSTQYISKIESLYRVNFEKVSQEIKSYRLGENLQFSQIPSTCYLPSNQLTYDDERALDLYVEHWNSKQSLNNSPIKIDWTPDHSKHNLIVFRVISK